MAFFHVQYQSPALRGGGEFIVMLPERMDNTPCRVLTVLHGAFGECLGSFLQSSLYRYASGRNMAIVAPTSHLGVYTDMDHGEAGYSFLKEALERAQDMFPVLSKKREDHYILGISMGGHGAYKLAMEYPERFAAAAALSSPIDVVHTMELLEAGKHPGGPELYHAFTGSKAYAGSKGDVIAMAKKRLAEGVRMPRLFLCWGDKDHARFEDVITVEKFREMGYPLVTRVGCGGHNFDMWDPMLEDILDWLMKGGEGNGAA